MNRSAVRDRLASFCERHFTALRAVVVVGLMALAWHNRFVQDDAFIVFRYADHLARGQGLVFNLGERVEGYTCFLYVLLVAAGLKLGFEPIAVSYAIGLASFAGTLWATFGLARRLTGSRLVALAAIALLGTHYTFSAFATGGLETQFHAFLVMSFLNFGAAELPGVRLPEAREAAASPAVGSGEIHPPRGDRSRAGPRPARFAMCSLLGALATLTRPDAGLLVLPMGLALAWEAVASANRRRVRLLGLIALVAPGALLLVAWLAWKLAYYGSLLPNTFYVKVASRAALTHGVYYLYRYITSYWLEAGLLFAAWKWRLVLADGRVAISLTCGALLWTAFVVGVGGDFMEFRLLVPVMPLIAILMVRTAILLERGAGLGMAMGAVLLAGSLQHAEIYNRTPHHDGIQSVWQLKSFLWAEDQNWVGIGKALHRVLGEDSGVVIATTAAGAIPYYSRLTTVDMLGLNDRWIARHGVTQHDMPGHGRFPTLDYLLDRRVNLMLGHPRMGWEATPARLFVQEYPVPRYVAGLAEGRKFPPGLKALEIPIDPDYRLVVLYLTPNAAIDRAIREHGWRMREVADRDAPK